MRLALKRHPDSSSRAVTRIELEIARSAAGMLSLRYLVNGMLDDLLMPPNAAPVHTDGLWEHTCFEAFVRPDLGESYSEYNFSPSTAWAAYRFDRYRSGRRDAETDPPRIKIRSGEECLTLRATLELPDIPLRLGLSAVIEETDGTRSYWALAHPPGDPDFHHPDCFALELPAASGT